MATRAFMLAMNGRLVGSCDASSFGVVLDDLMRRLDVEGGRVLDPMVEEFPARVFEVSGIVEERSPNRAIEVFERSICQALRRSHVDVGDFDSTETLRLVDLHLSDSPRGVMLDVDYDY